MKRYKSLSVNLLLALLLLSCSGIEVKEALKKPKDLFSRTEKRTKTPSQELIPVNRWVFNDSFEEVWEATLKSISWIKWKPFLVDHENKKIFLKEAYVYEDNGSIKRVYTWPPLDKLKESNLSRYIETITHADRYIERQTAFTQENMRIKIEEQDGKKTVVEISYEIIPHLRTQEIGTPLKSKNYIEGIIIQKIKEYLSSKNP